MTKAKRDIKRKHMFFKHYEQSGDVSLTCRHFGIARQTFYAWKKLHQQFGEEGLINHKPCPGNPTLQIAPVYEATIMFIDHVIARFPFRIHTVRTDNAHGFQARFHWNVEDLGIGHYYIKPGTPRLNSKVEPSHLTDQQEFYQLLTYIDDVDLNEKLQVCENYHSFQRPHGSLNGKAPYEVLKDKLTNLQIVSPEV